MPAPWSGPTDGVRVTAPSGRVLSGESFRLAHDAVESSNVDLVAALTPLRSQLAFLPERPSFLSVSGPAAPMLIVAERTPDGVVGARLSHEALEALLADAGSRPGRQGRAGALRAPRRYSPGGAAWWAS